MIAHNRNYTRPQSPAELCKPSHVREDDHAVPSYGPVDEVLREDERVVHVVHVAAGEDSPAQLLRRQWRNLSSSLSKFVSATVSAITEKLTWITPPLRGGGCAGPPS